MRKRLDIKITYQCNNRCKFCVQGKKRGFCNDKDYEEIKEILNTHKNDYGQVVFTGGEPTIRPDILRIISLAKTNGYKVHIQSNGRMFAYKKFCKDIIRSGVSAFTISIHGNNATSHEDLTKARGSFDQTVSGIKNILSNGFSLYTNTVIAKSNYQLLPKIAEFLINLGVRQYKFSFPHIIGSALANCKNVITRKEIAIPFVKRGLEIGIQNGCRAATEAIPYCLLGKYAKFASERYTPDTYVFDTEKTKSFKVWRKQEGKSKGPLCSQCRHCNSCEGPWREYPQLFGWNEFVPIT
ncbi:radical SAM protein [Thermoproteota archaeon]